MFSTLIRRVRRRFNCHRRTMALRTAQERAYASEAAENFRWLSTLLATKSNHTLTAADLVDDATYSHISDIGQYTEIAHGSISPLFVFQNMNELCRPGFPLESYSALKNDGAILVKQFTGSVVDVQGYVAFRPNSHELVAAFSGTSSFAQALKDMQSWRTVYPLDGEKQSTVHAGFWEMYKGVRQQAFEALRLGFQTHGCNIDKVVLTGHSMGCIMCYLLALELMAKTEEDIFPYGVPLVIILFGSPRLGNDGLARYWRRSVDEYRNRFGSDSFCEYSVKAYNDGAHTLPPYSLGFRHLTESPLYFYLGRLYRVPSSESEHGAFNVSDLTPAAQNDTQAESVAPISTSAGSSLGKKLEYVAWTKGGHNYYFRDMEKFNRRMQWLEINLLGEAGWQERYMAKAKAWEEKWGKELDNSVP